MGCFHSKNAKLPASPADHSLPLKPVTEEQVDRDIGVTEEQVDQDIGVTEEQVDQDIGVTEEQVDQETGVPYFKMFKLSELWKATDGFSRSCVVSEDADKASNVVYRGMLQGNRPVAIKCFSTQSWPDANQFVTEAAGVGNLRYIRLVNLIGCCAEGDWRLLVAEFMPNETLARHLFDWEDEPLPWEMRVRVADHIAQALHYCNVRNRMIYHDLNSYRILFDEEGDPRLSTFGLMKNSSNGESYTTNLAYTPPEFSQTGIVIPQSVVYSYGTVLIDLLSGKHLPPNHALDMIRGRNASMSNVLLIMDPSLEGKFDTENAIRLVIVASKCLRNEPRDRPDTKTLAIAALSLQKQREVASHVLMGPRKKTVKSERLPNILSPLGKACSRLDLGAVHEILVTTGYEDEEGTDNEFSYQERTRTREVQEMLNIKKYADLAFRDKDYLNAIEFYSKLERMMSGRSATVYARRSFSYLKKDEYETALRDAVKAQVCIPEWPIAFYLQGLALMYLGMESDAIAMLKDAAAFEAKRRHVTWRF